MFNPGGDHYSGIADAAAESPAAEAGSVVGAVGVSAGGPGPGPTVLPLWGGDPAAPGATPDLIGARVVFGGLPAGGRTEIDLNIDNARALFGRLGDLLRQEAV